MAKRLLRDMQKQKAVKNTVTNLIPILGTSKSVASFAQQRIWFDEQIYSSFEGGLTPYNILIPMQIKHGSMSIERIRSTLNLVLEHNHVLRTAVYFNVKDGKVEQEVRPNTINDSFSFQITCNVRDLTEIDSILFNESTTRFAQLERGLVLRCHVVKLSDKNDNYLYSGDILIFVIHHIAFDLRSIPVFQDVFTQAYDMVTLNRTPLQYIDYTLYEQAQSTVSSSDSSMSKARQFWEEIMNNYNADQYYPLPYALNKTTKSWSGRSHSLILTLDNNLANMMTLFAASTNISMFHLGLACYFTFLYQTSSRNTEDLCVIVPTHNRPLPELHSIIGMFVNLIPYRIKFDPTESFSSLVQRIKDLSINILEHAHLPYQEIMNYSISSTAKTPFSFQYEPQMSSMTYGSTVKTKFKTAELCPYGDHNWAHSNGIALNDFSLTMIHNHQTKRIQYIIECSADLYDEETLLVIRQHYHHFLMQFFSTGMENSPINEPFATVRLMNLFPPEKDQELEKTKFHRLPDIIDIGKYN